MFDASVLNDVCLSLGVADKCVVQSRQSSHQSQQVHCDYDIVVLVCVTTVSHISGEQQRQWRSAAFV